MAERRFGNLETQHLYDKSHGQEKPPMQEHQEPDADDVESVVAQHGPAQEVHISHDHEAGRHHVESHHGGHVHQSEHGSAEEAHEHGKKAAGIQSEEGNQKPEEDEYASVDEE